MLGKDKSALETIKAQAAYGAFGLIGPGSRPGWLASLPHRIGARLFAMNDTEADWRGWEITRLLCGLSRSYRDPRFDLLRLLRTLDPQAAGATDWPIADPTEIVRRADGWDDVHGWPWDEDR
jgi:hypothetical protein